MSVQAMAWALQQRRVSKATHRHVLLCLANYAGEDGAAAWPSQARLARDTGLTERGVRKALSEMEECGAIRRGNQAIAAAHIQRADRRPIVYDLVMDDRAEHGSARDGRNVVPPGRVNGGNLATERGEPRSAEPSINHQVDQEQGAGAPLPEWLEPEAWAMWNRYRNARKGWTADAKALSLRTLTELRDAGHDPGAVIEQSIERGWTGLFPVRGYSVALAGSGRTRPNDDFSSVTYVGTPNTQLPPELRGPP